MFFFWDVMYYHKNMFHEVPEFLPFFPEKVLLSTVNTVYRYSEADVWNRCVRMEAACSHGIVMCSAG